jgi:sugar lactone lactonase YvrE
MRFGTLTHDLHLLAGGPVWTPREHPLRFVDIPGHRIHRFDWFNHRRLLEPIGHVPPAEAEVDSCAAKETLALAA